MKHLKNILIILLLFSFLYPFSLNSLSMPLNRLFQILGLGCFLLVVITTPSLKRKSELLQYCFIFFLLAFICFISYLINNNAEFTPIRTMLYSISLLFGAYFIYKLWGRIYFVKVLDFIVIATLLQALISFIFFFYPDIKEIVFSYLVMSELDEIAFSRISHRLVGIGTGFFGAGVNYGINLLILTSLAFLPNSILYKNKVIYILALLIILLAGIMSARVFFLGVVFSLFLFLYLSKLKLKRILSLITIIILCSFIGYVILLQLYSTGENDAVFDWAFELFISYKTTGELTTSSTEVLSTMYIYPDNLKTWMIGDGRWTSGGFYYMGTDVGFSRLLFLFGIIGTFLYYVSWFKIWSIISTLHSNSVVSKLFLFIILFSLFCNLKGHFIPAMYFALFLVYGLMYPNKKNTLQ